MQSQSQEILVAYIDEYLENEIKYYDIMHNLVSRYKKRKYFTSVGNQ